LFEKTLCEAHGFDGPKEDFVEVVSMEDYLELLGEFNRGKA
jgi:hypothetical protein